MKLYFSWVCRRAIGLVFAWGHHRFILENESLLRTQRSFISGARVILVAWGFVFLGSLVLAGQAPSSAKDVEIFYNGKGYKSIRDYKHEQMRQLLRETLSERDLDEFSDEEILAIIREARDERGKNPVDEPSKLLNDVEAQGAAPALDDSYSQNMQEMLKDYLEDHKEANDLVIDPGKVKSIIITPEKKTSP